jgi:hypothetical protein
VVLSPVAINSAAERVLQYIAEGSFMVNLRGVERCFFVSPVLVAL